jgi:transcriptional regulator of heat shock response
MEDRHKKIFAAIIEEYTKTAVPVGSKMLVDKYGFDMSAATIRGDMAELEKKGYLFQPHVSAGRIPTDKGYRFFVEEVMPDQKLSISDQKKLQAELLKLKAQNTRLSRTTAKLLSSLSGSLAITGMKSDFYDFGMSELLENPEFKNIDEFSRIAEVLDYIDENVDSILSKIKDGETKIFIGHENPIKAISNCSMVVTPWRSKSGERGLLALIGPKRMRYAKNKSILDFVKKLISSSNVVIMTVTAGSVGLFLR